MIHKQPLVTFSRDGHARVLEASLWVPHPPEAVFPFFADAANLEQLTPPWLNFRILTPLPIEMRQGALIDYRIVLRGLPMKWRTEITAWEPGRRFVDEQLRGPYSLWVHEHTFARSAGGTICGDRVRYAHIGGPPIHALFVKPQLKRIFEYRRQQMIRLFGDPAGTPGATAQPATPAG